MGWKIGSFLGSLSLSTPSWRMMLPTVSEYLQESYLQAEFKIRVKLKVERFIHDPGICSDNLH